MGDLTNDPRMQTAARQLEASGHRMFSAIVPQMRIRISTGEAIWALPGERGASGAPARQEDGTLTLELRDVASVMMAKIAYFIALPVTVRPSSESLACHRSLGCTGTHTQDVDLLPV